MSNVIIIPIYKPFLSSDEIISLEQCFKILSQHEIIFVSPQDLDISSYQNILNKEIKVEYFKPEYFQNIRGYNQLMLSLEFYERFQNYEFMLIYQLDCYVFRDELEYWCKQGYDYIGAPWLEHFYYQMSKFSKLKFLIQRYFKLKYNKDKDILVYNTGNGGFSLRRISKFIKIIKTTPDNILNKFRESNDPKSLFNEDVFWSFEAKRIKKPNYKLAARFSLDTGADIGYRLNNKSYPFGCHAWNRDYHHFKKVILDEPFKTL